MATSKVMLPKPTVVKEIDSSNEGGIDVCVPLLAHSSVSHCIPGIHAAGSNKVMTN